MCAVCKAVCLCCEGCRERLDELHCKDHRALADCYFWFLDKFDAAELQRQRTALQVRKPREE